MKKHTSYGIASLVIGIIAMCFIWLAVSILGYFVWLLPAGILAVVLGDIANKRYNDKFGLAGFILGLFVLIIGFVLMLFIYFILSRTL